jgi:hypothetical protein
VQCVVGAKISAVRHKLALMLGQGARVVPQGIAGTTGSSSREKDIFARSHFFVLCRSFEVKCGIVKPRSHGASNHDIGWYQR